MLIAVGLSNIFDVTIEVQNSVLGLVSADPWIVDLNTNLIWVIDYLTAKEIIWARWFQTRLLHNHLLRQEVIDAEINILLLDSYGWLKWTIINKNWNAEANWVEYIGWRKDVIFLSISIWKNKLIELLPDILKIVKEYTIADVLISPTNTEISFTIDSWLSDEKLENLSNKIKLALNEKGDYWDDCINYEKSKALIYCIWQKLHLKTWILGKAASILWGWDINIEKVFPWTMDRSMVFKIESENMEKAIKLLHDWLIYSKSFDVQRMKHWIIV